MVDEFEVVVRSAVTMHGLVLLMKTGENSDWELPGVVLSHDEDVDEAVKSEVEDLTGLEVNIHQVVDAANATEYSENANFEVLVHAEAESEEYRKDSPIEFEWVDPGQIKEKLDEDEQRRLETSRAQNFIEKLEKMPTRGF